MAAADGGRYTFVPMSFDDWFGRRWRSVGALAFVQAAVLFSSRLVVGFDNLLYARVVGYVLFLFVVVDVVVCLGSSRRRDVLRLLVAAVRPAVCSRMAFLRSFVRR